MEALLRLENINKQNHMGSVLSDVNLSVEESDFLVLFGSDGSGKTALLNIAMGFDLDYEGQASLFGEDVRRLSRVNYRRVRFVPDDILRMEGMTGREYLEMAGAASVDYSKKIEAVMCGHFQISLDEQLLSMTYRNNKLVQITAAVAAKPQLLILDEPINFLDADTYHKLLRLLANWSKNLMGVLLVAEKYEQADGLARHYAYMREGRIVRTEAVPEEDFRTKIVTLTGGRAAELEPLLKTCIAKKNGRYTYSIKSSSESLMRMLSVCNCTDVVIEEMTLQEELEEDYSRWI